MKKILIVSFIILIIAIIFIVLFNKKNNIWEISQDSINFKNEYESVNDSVYSNGTKYLELTIPESNPFVYLDYEETLDLIEKGTGILFFSRPGCPYCRSTMNATIEFAKKNNIEKIYYYNPEFIRTENNEEYKKLLKLLDKELPIDIVTQKEEDEDFDSSLKRIVVPHLFFINNKEIIFSYQEGRSEFAGELTEKQEEEIIFIYEEGYKKYKKSISVCSPTEPNEC